ncbi:hypothetical protein M9H77_02183 [Catharanthus roseus]|uniref:Uncharacterized protein n=1 Tax=Catharanthus roseus TaxID=4058 RepID=A0ACC0C7P2_CATRO|nr:hypothetical protein M9H77_02183 [Catharanthus roseus]
MEKMDRAKVLLMQDPNYKRGFRFDHVWNVVKDFEKFTDKTTRATQVYRLNFLSSECDTQTSETQVLESPGLSDFQLNLSDDIVGGSSQRSIGVKKDKPKTYAMFDQYFNNIGGSSSNLPN